MNYSATINCSSCGVDGVYPTHNCEALRAEVLSIRVGHTAWRDTVQKGTWSK